MNHLLNNNRLTAVVAGGCFMIVAALLMQRVHDPGAETAGAEISGMIATDRTISPTSHPG
jgi:hypothetical protein